MNKFYIIFLCMLNVFAFGEQTRIKYEGKSALATVADAEISYNIKKNDYVVSVNGNSSGIASLLDYELKLLTSGALINNSTTPKHANIFTNRRGKKRDIDMFFSPSPKITITPHWRAKPKERLNGSHISSAIDMSSVLVRILNQYKLKNKCYGTFNVTDGRSAYRLVLTDRGRDKVSTKAYKGYAQKCRITVRVLSGRALRDVSTNDSYNLYIYLAKMKNKSYLVPIKIDGKYAGFNVTFLAKRVY